MLSRTSYPIIYAQSLYNYLAIFKSLYAKDPKSFMRHMAYICILSFAKLDTAILDEKSTALAKITGSLALSTTVIGSVISMCRDFGSELTLSNIPPDNMVCLLSIVLSCSARASLPTDKENGK